MTFKINTTYQPVLNELAEYVKSWSNEAKNLTIEVYNDDNDLVIYGEDERHVYGLFTIKHDDENYLLNGHADTIEGIVENVFFTILNNFNFKNGGRIY